MPCRTELGNADTVTTTRQITVLLSRHLGVDVTPWAARLVRERNAYAREVMADIESQMAE